MLAALSIRDVVLIDRLDLDFSGGLSALTGETGAGKSILLDSLGLALGNRADAKLVRTGAEKASVTARFDLPAAHPAFALMAEQGLDDGEGSVILRRVLGGDGRSKAFVNDQPVSVGFLKALGETLVEIHGQFENQSLLSPTAHRALLDAYGGLGDIRSRVAAAWKAWAEARAAREAAEAAQAQAAADEEFLRHAVAELADFAPEPGEEAALAEKRTMMMHGEKLIEAMNHAASALEDGGGKSGRGGLERTLRDAMRHLDGVRDKAEGRLDGALEALDKASGFIAEAADELARAAASVDLDPAHLETAEERLFALRALARKHGVAPDDLAALQEQLNERLAGLEDGGAALKRLRAAEAAARGAYIEVAEALSVVRAKAAKGLDKAVMGELAPLKLEKAIFRTNVERLGEDGWSETGMDRAAFEVATNPGTAPGPLNKIASGGELARFMLALKVVLAKADPIPTLIFDEVDTGIGGAVADAVGERLARLGQDVQVLVVTHAPQVAARAATHMQVAKGGNGKSTTTSVAVLPEDRRLEEIARMLAGATITDEARAAAARLIAAGT